MARIAGSARAVGSLLAGIALVGLLTGCGPNDGVAAGSVSPTPSANAVTDAVIQSKGLATAAIEVDAMTSIGGVERTQHGSGEVDVSRGMGAITWTADDGSVVREISNGKGLFVQSAGPDSMWTHLPDATATPTGRLADPLRGLGGLTGVTADGTEVIGGEEAGRYRGSMAADPTALTFLGLPDATVAALGDTWQGTRVDVVVWVTGSGRVVRIDRSWSAPTTPAGPVSARTSTRLSDYVSLINIDPPPAESVASSG